MTMDEYPTTVNADKRGDIADADDSAGVEELDLADNQFIALEQSREWPKYVVTWSIRRREGDADYPIASGCVERMPEDDIEALLASMRAEAIQQAKAQVQSTVPAKSSPSLLDRLFKRT